MMADTYLAVDIVTGALAFYLGTSILQQRSSTASFQLAILTTGSDWDYRFGTSFVRELSFPEDHCTSIDHAIIGFRDMVTLNPEYRP